MATGSARRVTIAAFALIAAALIVRWYVVASGNFYWDDLILIGRSSTFPWLSTDLLLYDHDGHFMPGAFLAAGVTTALAPLQWWLPALTLLGLQAAASCAVFRLLRAILGSRPILLLPLIFYLFSPLTLPSFAWWAAALNSLPLQFALAWVAADAITFARTGRRRYVVTGALVTAGALLFFEKAVLVPFFAFVVLAVSVGVRAAWRRAAMLWVACAVILVVWGVVFVLVARTGLAFHGWRTTADLAHHGISLGLLPAAVGGPWFWERWPPAGPWADPPVGLVVAVWLMLLVAVALTVRRHAKVWVALVAYIGVSCAAMVLSRSGPDTADELAQTLRYVADSAVVVAAAAALMLRRHRASNIHRGWVVVATAFVVGSLVSSYTFVQKWEDDPAGDYLANATKSLADNRDVPLLDQPVSPWVLTPMAYPENSAARIFGGLDPNFASSTPELRYLDDDGNIRPAVVSPSRSITQGPESGCGHRVDGTVRVPLDQAIPNWDWTVQLNYFSPEPAEISMELDTGDPVVVDLESGLNTVFVRLTGSGSTLTMTTDGVSVCVGSGPVGVVMLPDN